MTLADDLHCHWFLMVLVLHLFSDRTSKDEWYGFYGSLQMPFLSPNQQFQVTEGTQNTDHNHSISPTVLILSSFTAGLLKERALLHLLQDSAAGSL